MMNKNIPTPFFEIDPQKSVAKIAEEAYLEKLQNIGYDIIQWFDEENFKGLRCKNTVLQHCIWIDFNKKQFSKYSEEDNKIHVSFTLEELKIIYTLAIIWGFFDE